MKNNLDVLEDLLFDLKYPLLASFIIIDLLTDDCDTDWEIWGKYQTIKSYDNYKSLIYTLKLLNKRMSSLRRIYNRKLDYLYKHNLV